MITRYMGSREYVAVVATVLFIIGQVYFDISIPAYMSRITGAYLLEDHDTVVEYGLGMVLCAFGSLVMSVCAGYTVARFGASIGRNMRRAQFEKVQMLSAQDISRFSAASLITRTTNDVTQIQTFVSRGLQILIKAPLLAVWATSCIWGRSLEWTALTVGGLLLLMAVILTSLYLAMPKFRNIQWLTDAVNRSSRENLDGIRVIRAYNAESHQSERYSRANDELLSNNISAAGYMAPAFPFAQSMMNFITLGIYWIGAGLIAAAQSGAEQKLLFSDMIVFASYATMVLSACMMFLGIFRMLPRAMVGLKRVGEVVDYEPSIVEGQESDGPEKGTIEFRNVSFRYPGSVRDSLRDVSFRVECGQTVAVIGPTGSGKTTLMNLINRFYDVGCGQVLVDGRDVREYKIQALRSRFGYVPQTAILFSGSVEDNVNYGAGSETRTDGDVRRALRVAQAEGFVDALPEGPGSSISQHGRNLSGGQKQRIAIARAVCRSPEIYLLDDSLSALDFITESELRRALKDEVGDSSALIVAQRIGSIRDADRIIVMDGGRIVGAGTHEELMGDCPLYRELADIQSVGEAAR